MTAAGKVLAASLLGAFQSRSALLAVVVGVGRKSRLGDVTGFRLKDVLSLQKKARVEMASCAYFSTKVDGGEGFTAVRL